MMSIVRTIFIGVLCGALTYAAFTYPIGGKTVASHLVDIWLSPPVQKKVDAARSDIEQRVARQMQNAKNKARAAHTAEDYTEGERDLLKGVIAERIKKN
jgi:hypothetical protein